LYDKTRALQAATRKEPFAESAFFSILFIAIPVARIVQGLSNRRPVTSLIIELAILLIVYVLLGKALFLKTAIRSKVRSIYLGQLPVYNDQTVPLFALEGNSAIVNLAGGAPLMALFSAYQPLSGRGWSSDSGSSADSGSSCSNGSSCSGGSSCGSSCGGCSGN